MITPDQIAYINARLIDPASGLDAMGALITFGGEIQAVGADLFPGEAAPDVSDQFQIIDCQGHVLCPGLIDMRVFVGEPGAEHKETLATASQAAAAGGVTSIIVMPDTNPVIDDASLVDYIKRRSRDTAIVNVYPMAALTKGLEGAQLTEMGLLKEAGAIAFTDGHRPVTNSRLMRQALSYASTFGALVVHHAEDPSLTQNGAMNEGEFASRLGLAGIPAAAETIIVERDVALVELTQGRYHLSQLSCAASLRVIEQAKERGLDITCAVSAHHLALNELDVGEYRTFFKTNPPLRAEEDRQAMVDGLSRGAIDIIVSSHDPQAPENKRLPFADASPGSVGLETLLPVALEHYHNGDIPLCDLLKAMTAAPAQRLGLPSGRLAPGAPADLALIDLGAPYVFDAGALKSRSKNTPFDGRKLQGRVLRTVVGGKSVYERENALQAAGER